MAYHSITSLARSKIDVGHDTNRLRRFEILAHELGLRCRRPELAIED